MVSQMRRVAGGLALLLVVLVGRKRLWLLLFVNARGPFDGASCAGRLLQSCRGPSDGQAVPLFFLLEAGGRPFDGSAPALIDR